MHVHDVVVMGAGSIGQPIALELALRGLNVAIIDRLSAPGRGQNRAAIGGMRATHSDPAKIEICTRSLDIVKRMESEHGLPVDWFQGGYLYPAYDPHTEHVLKSLLTTQQEAGLDIAWVDAETIYELVPGIVRNGLRGGNYSPGDGSTSPLKLSLAYSLLCRRAGVSYHMEREITGFRLAEDRIVRIDTSRDSFSCGTIIDATGAGARTIGAMLGLDIPVFPESHEAGITEPARRFFQPMVVDIRPGPDSANYYFYQNKENQVVFCLTPDPAIPGTDQDCTSAFLPQVTSRMMGIYPRLRNLRVRRTWRGLYPMTPDGFPIVGPAGYPENLWLAVGMCGQGFMLGPGLGQIMADIIADGSTAHQEILGQLKLQRDFSGEEKLK